jgi:hypothetical protein
MSGNPSADAHDDITPRYVALTDRYGMIATRISLAGAHESGALERARHPLKKTLEDVLFVARLAPLRELSSKRKAI